MPALPWPVLRPLGHERGHHAVPLREDLGVGLEQRAAVRGFERLTILNGRFEHARPGLGVQAFERNAQPGAHAHELVIELRMHARAQHGVAEEARRQGCEVAKTLLAHRLRRFLEHEEFEFGGGVHRVAQVVGLLEHAPQRGARTHRFGLLGELAEEHDHVAFERDVAAGVGQHADGCIRIGGVPAGVLHVVIELVVRVPAQHHVAEAETLVERREELVAAHVLAAHDAVVVEDPDLDVIELALLDDLACIGRGTDVFWLHGALFLYEWPRSMGSDPICWQKGPDYECRKPRTLDLFSYRPRRGDAAVRRRNSDIPDFLANGDRGTTLARQRVKDRLPARIIEGGAARGDQRAGTLLVVPSQRSAFSCGSYRSADSAGAPPRASERES